MPDAASNRGFLLCSMMTGALLLPLTLQAQDSRTANVIVLKDPTPRPVELDKVYGTSDASPTTAPTAKPSATLYERRKALMVRASHQVSILAATLEKAVAANSSTTSRTQEIQLAALIELLAGDLHTAMAPAASAKVETKHLQGTAATEMGPSASEPVTSETAELVSLAKELEEGVEKLSQDTFSVSVLAKSSQVLQLAHNLKQRLSAP